MKAIPGLHLQGDNLDLDGAIATGITEFELLWPECIGDMHKLQERLVHPVFHIRIYGPNRMGNSAENAARIDYHRFLNGLAESVRGCIGSVRPANELNLDHEHQGDVPWPTFWKSVEAYKRINDWLIGYSLAWQQEVLEHGWDPILVWPCLSPGNNPPDTPPESEYELLRASMLAYDVIAVNAYGNRTPEVRWDEWAGAKRLGRIVSKIRSLGFEMPIWMTETNMVNFAEMAIYASELGVEKVMWFLWKSAGDDHRQLELANPKYQWMAGLEGYIASFEENGNGTGNGEEPRPEQDLAKVYPDFTKAWLAAGGDMQGDLRRALWGSYVVHATPEDIAKMADDIRSEVTNLERVALRRHGVKPETPLRERLLATAWTMIGRPYKWDGEDPSGFDCSGFITWLFRSEDIEISSFARDQWVLSRKAEYPRTADLIFFEDTYDFQKHHPGLGRPYITHVGIMIDDSRFISATPAKGVGVDNRFETYWKSHFHSFGSIIP